MREIIKNRRSVRNYTGKEIKVHIVKTIGEDNSRIGTYGVIKNAPNYIK